MTKKELNDFIDEMHEEGAFDSRVVVEFEDRLAYVSTVIDDFSLDYMLLIFYMNTKTIKKFKSINLQNEERKTYLDMKIEVDNE